MSGAAFDPEAEQEVDFGRYFRALGARWWVVAAGVIVGALVGYAISVGGTNAYKATAVLYLGQPYSIGGAQLQNLQTNASTVKTIVHAQSVVARVASECGTRTSAFSRGISTQAIAGNITKNGQTAETSITVQSTKRRVTACVANGLGRQVILHTSAYADEKIANLRAQLQNYKTEIARIDAALQKGELTPENQLLLQLRLSNDLSARLNTSQQLLQATLVEKPSILTGARATKVTALSRPNVVVVAALIGLVLGAIAALMWDGLMAGLSRRRT